jgi:hypothetical protein
MGGFHIFNVRTSRVSRIRKSARKLRWCRMQRPLWLVAAASSSKPPDYDHQQAAKNRAPPARYRASSAGRRCRVCGASQLKPASHFLAGAIEYMKPIGRCAGVLASHLGKAVLGRIQQLGPSLRWHYSRPQLYRNHLGAAHMLFGAFGIALDGQIELPHARIGPRPARCLTHHFVDDAGSPCRPSPALIRLPGGRGSARLPS